MANPRPIRTHPGPTEHPELDRCSHVEISLPTAPQTGADEVYGPTLSVAVDDGSQDEGCDEPEDYRDFGDWKEDYADSVGISSWREL